MCDVQMSIVEYLNEMKQSINQLSNQLPITLLYFMTPLNQMTLSLEPQWGVEYANIEEIAFRDIVTK